MIFIRLFSLYPLDTHVNNKKQLFPAFLFLPPLILESVYSTLTIWPLVGCGMATRSPVSLFSLPGCRSSQVVFSDAAILSGFQELTLIVSQAWVVLISHSCSSQGGSHLLLVSVNPVYSIVKCPSIKLFNDSFLMCYFLKDADQ